MYFKNVSSEKILPTLKMNIQLRKEKKAKEKEEEKRLHIKERKKHKSLISAKR